MLDGAPLLLSAATIGVLHTALGPDHSLPFIALARARHWSGRRTALITTLCGLAHVGSSALLGLIGVGLGSAVFHLERVEAARGPIAAWLMLGFGLAYAAWGVRRALRGDGHAHSHAHADGTRHRHPHRHDGAHVHPHDAAEDGARTLTVWTLFLIFGFGPCEPLIPLLLYPAATGGVAQAALVVTVFGLATIATMLAVVFAALALAPPQGWPRLARWEHALAGLVVAGCGAAMTAGL
ncbi:MAG: sulfite exporter TauE/SafE family protein [Deltaproteobacteria bacterium]|nr:sulfite exporter TauE/SafE family protein [Deltaproteobacteria bacterium]